MQAVCRLRLRSFKQLLYAYLALKVFSAFAEVFVEALLGVEAVLLPPPAIPLDSGVVS